MKRLFNSLLVLLIIFSLLLSGCVRGQKSTTEQPKTSSEQTAPKTVEIKYVGEYPEKHPVVVNVIKPWFQSVQEKSGNAVNFTYFPANTLVPMKDSYNATVSGMVDILGAPNLYTIDKFPEVSIMNYPFVAPSSEAGSLVIFELMKKFPQIQKRFSDTKFLTAWLSPVIQLNTTKKLVKNLDDIRGMKIIALDTSQIEIVKALGGNPVEVTLADTYLALQRGVADAILLPFAPLRSFKIDEVAKYHTVINLHSGVFISVMNKATFEGLPPNVQKIFEETGGEQLGQSIGKILDQADAEGQKWMEDNGHTFYVLPEAEKKKVEEKLQSVVDILIQKSEAKGATNAREIYEEAKRLGEEIGKKIGRG